MGGLRAEQGEREVARFRTQKAGALLAYLAFYCDRAHPRELLIEVLWPGNAPAAGRHRLSVDLHSLRKQLEPPGVPQGSVLKADHFSIQLNPAAVQTDVAEFEAALRSAGTADSAAEQAGFLAEAVDLYRGELLPGHYEDWVLTEQRRLADLYFDAIQKLTKYLQQEEDWQRALDYGRKAVAVDPLREEGHRELMRLLAGAGQPSAALRQYEELCRILMEELEAVPSAATTRLAGEIESQGHHAQIETPPAGMPVAKAGEAPSPSLLVGTVTFLLAEIRAAASRESKDTPAVEEVVTSAKSRLSQSLQRHGGYILRERDGLFSIAFPQASGALATGVECQEELRSRSDCAGAGVFRVRMALDTREVRPKDGEAPGRLLRRATSLLSAAHSGQILCSESAAALLRGHMEADTQLAELGFYRLRGARVPEPIYAIEYPGIRVEDFPPPKATPAYSSNLPLRLTSFFGREEELTQLQEVLQDEGARLVTLTGAGGSGKTRLAVETARQLLDAWRGAVWFVGLEDLADPLLIDDAVLTSLHIPRSPRLEAIDQVVAFFSRQPSLLVLDNFEQLVEGGASRVAALLERVPTLTCLVTSRRVLNLSGEREYLVSPLPTPPEAECPEELMQCSSIELFVDRAQGIRPDFQITPANAGAVSGLCRRLEGLPLALELAAARIGTLTPAQMLEQLESRLDFLVGRKRDMAGRHRTIRAAVDWSYQLLPEDLQRFFARLSVFRGGWTAEAAAGVCDQAQNLDCLETLRECSLILAEDGAGESEGMRFRMMDTLREFADEQLPPDDQKGLRQRHADWCLSLAEKAEPNLWGLEQNAWLERLEKEHDNFRTALEWCLSDVGSADEGLRLAAALCRFWQIRGYLKEGRAHLEETLNRKEAQSPAPTRAKALVAAGNLAAELGEYEGARLLLEKSLSIQRALGDKYGTACSLSNLGLVVKDQGDYKEALRLFEESLAAHRELGDKRGEATSLGNLGNLAVDRGDYTAARGFLEESLSIRRELNDSWGIAASLNNLGDVAKAEGDFSAAKALYEEALGIIRKTGNRGWEAVNLYNLACVFVSEEDYSKARLLLTESLSIWGELGKRRDIAYGLEKLATVWNRSEEPERAAWLFGAAGALREDVGAPLPPNERDEYDREVAAVRETIGAEAFDAAWDSGRHAPADEAIAVALEEEPPGSG